MRAREQLRRVLLQKGEAHLIRHRVRELLSVQLLELRLRVEQIHLAHPALHVEEDATLRARHELRGLRRQRIHRRREQSLRAEQRREGQPADAARGVHEEIAASERENILCVHELCLGQPALD